PRRRSWAFLLAAAPGNLFRSVAGLRFRQAFAACDRQLDRPNRARFSARHRRFPRYSLAPDFLPTAEQRSHGQHMTGGEILKIRGLYKTFGGLAAVDNVSLQVRTGELHAVIGPNGAGKT